MINILKAKVEKLLITQPLGVPPVNMSKVKVLLDGIKYDRHSGRTRNADVRTAMLLSKGIEVANLRQISIISSEELKEISEIMGVEITAEDLDANITLSGIEKLTKIQPGTFLRFPANTILYVTAENLPCVEPSENMIKRGVDKDLALKFAKAAFGKRGLTAITFASGFIKVGDEVEVIIPQNLEN